MPELPPDAPDGFSYRALAIATLVAVVVGGVVVALLLDG